MKFLLRSVFAAVCAVQPLLASAHHSMAEWDTSIIEEMEGEVVNVVWSCGYGYRPYEWIPQLQKPRERRVEPPALSEFHITSQE